MRLEITAPEAELLETLLDAALRGRLHEIHHTDSRDYRKRLQKETELIESLTAKLSAKSDAA
jgi:hypothetical protein